MPKISREIPLSEITLRKYERPRSDDPRELARKVCLSLGLLMPGDFRDVICDIMAVIATRRNPMTVEEIQAEVLATRKARGLDKTGTAQSNVRRQLRRLKSLYLIEHVHGRYRMTENLSLAQIWAEKIRPIILDSAVARIQDYLVALDSLPTPHKA